MAFGAPSRAVLFAIVAGTLVVGVAAGIAFTRTPGSFTYPQSTPPAYNPVILQPANPAPCSWKSAPFEGMDANEVARLTLTDACGQVQGKVQEIAKEVKGERTTYHFTLAPDASYSSMVNSENTKQLG